MSKPFIYFTGDSFMAGDELADDTLQCWKQMYGDYIKTKGFTPKDFETTKQKFYNEYIPIQRKEFETFSEERFKEFRNLVKTRTFAHVLCERNNFDYQNDGLGGCAQESMLHRAFLAFNRLANKDITPTLAVVMLTTPNRFTYYNEYVPTPFSTDWHKICVNETWSFDRSVMFTSVSGAFYMSKQNEFVEKFLMIESEQGNIVRQIHTIISMNSFFKEKTGKYPIYIIPTRYNLNCFDDPKLMKHPEYVALKEEAFGKTLILNMDDAKDDNMVCPGGHHTPKTHYNFALYIEQQILTWMKNNEQS